jgi:hypothetical protein
VALDLSYYDPMEQTWIESWGEENTGLPSSVRVVLYVLPEALEDEVEGTLESLLPFSTVVHLMLANAPLGQGQPGAESTQTGLGMEGEPAGEPGAEGIPGEGLPQLPTDLGIEPGGLSFPGGGSR